MISDESISRIDLLYNVAKLNDSALSLSDLGVLLSSETTLRELEDAFASSPVLSSRYNLRSGFIFEKGKDSAVAAEVTKRMQALGNVGLGTQIAARLKGKGSVVMAIGGSTSYESVKETDDLDLFCITRADYAWIFLTRALLLLRASRLTSPELAKACLSCVMDQNYADRSFGSEQDPLFARDALNAIVLEGGEEYRRLLLKAEWMSKMFPRLYSSRSAPSEPPETKRNLSRINRVVNLFLFRTVGTYLKTKSMLENRRIAKYASRGRLFETRLGADHCIYESLRYRQMRELYRGLDPK